MTTTRQDLVVGAVALVAMVALGACAPDHPSGPPSAYAAEFQAAYGMVTNPVAKAVLSDGVITDAELAEVRSQQIACLESLGVEVIQLDADGSTDIRPQQDSDEDSEMIYQRAIYLLSQCESETNWPDVGWLYTQTRSNPDNTDMYTLMAQGLVRMGLAPVGYTADDYQADFGSDTEGVCGDDAFCVRFSVVYNGKSYAELSFF